MDDVIMLLSTTITADDYGNQVETQVERQVFCQVRSITRAEFYNAAQTGLHPDYIFRISNFRDYQGEKLLKYTDWTDTEKVYNVLRTYRSNGEDALEITAEERTGSNV